MIARTPGAAPRPADIDHYRHLRAGSDLFRIMADSAADGLAVLQGSSIVDCNRRFEEIFARSREDILGRRPWELGERSPEARDAAERRGRELHARAYAGEIVRSEWEHRSADGQWRVHDVALSRFDLGDEPRLLGWVRDVTESVTAQRDLQARIDFQSRIVEISNQLIGAHARDLSGPISDVVRAVCAQHGIERACVWAVDRSQKLAYGNLSVGHGEEGGPLKIRPMSVTPGIVDRLFDSTRDVIRIPQDLSEEAVDDRRYFESRNVKSAIIIPYSMRENLVGFASLGMTSTSRDWSDEEILELRLMFQTIGSAWSRYLLDNSVRRREADLRRSQRVAGVGSFQIMRQDDSPLTWSNARLLQSGQADVIRGRPCCADTLRALLHVVHPDDKADVEARLRDMPALDGAIIDYRIRRGDGETVHVEERFEVDFDEDGGIEQIFGTIKDVTTRVRTTERLRGALDEIQKLKDQLEAENYVLREEVRTAKGFDRIIGNSKSLRGALQAAEKVAPTDVTVLILGETGTGKELVARSIHEISTRRKGPLVSVNCAALSSDLIESELFGHERGAFTDAVSSREGRFELADGGTLFLDEIGELPQSVQAKLLRVVQSGEFERLGGTRTLKVDVRVIAATNRNLEHMVAAGSFRDDLYYRINHFPIELPPLRERLEDVPILANHFLRRHARKLCKDIRAIAPAMLEDMMSRDWPGNVRELEAHIQRGMIAAEASVLDYRPEAPARRPASSRGAGQAARDLSLTTMQRRHIREALESCRWIIDGERGAAAVLGLPPSSLRSKMKRLGIRKPQP